MELPELKRICPLPVLLRKMGLGRYAKSSCKSPIREDENPSWGIFEKEGEWFWKDHGTGDHGDEITFLARYFDMNDRNDFPALLEKYSEIAAKPDRVLGPAVSPLPDRKPDLTGFTPGNEDQIKRLGVLRGISVEALKLARDRGFLVFEIWNGMEVYGLRDKSGYVLEIRRLDGIHFLPHGNLPQRKSHALVGSKKSWPVGTVESRPFPFVAMVEGVPDFLAIHDFLLKENVADTVAPVAMLGASAIIDDAALQLFQNKNVVVYPHADVSGAGLKAADRWAKQLRSAGAKAVKIFDMPRVATLTNSQVKDLNDLLKLKSETRAALLPGLQRILPNRE